MILVKRFIRWLMSVVGWLIGLRPSLVQLSLEPPDPGHISRTGRRGPEPPHRPRDPYNFVREPRWSGPPGRSAAAEVEEPVDDERLAAVGGAGGNRAQHARRVWDEP
ncbi:MAG TPA: hypothetical protein VKE96_18675 [Vicinamibacterales bacterium]|nr:hypothetical protein [Vicinamibacterales bacterium]